MITLPTPKTPLLQTVVVQPTIFSAAVGAQSIKEKLLADHAAITKKIRRSLRGHEEVDINRLNHNNPYLNELGDVINNRSLPCFTETTFMCCLISGLIPAITAGCISQEKGNSIGINLAFVFGTYIISGILITCLYTGICWDADRRFSEPFARWGALRNAASLYQQLLKINAALQETEMKESSTDEKLFPIP